MPMEEIEQELKPLDIGAFLKQPYFTIPAQMDFLNEGFKLTLTPQSRELFKLGNSGQGYIGLVDLETGAIHLLPSYNLEDGLTRVDKNGQPFEKFAQSRGALGQLGDLHSQVSSHMNLVAKSGTAKQLMGFGIWKGGFGIKLLNRLPDLGGLIPHEYLLIKKVNGYELWYVDQERGLKQIDLKEVPGLLAIDNIRNNASLESISTAERQFIEQQIKAFGYKKHPLNQDAPIKYVKNRSTSQNSYSIEYAEAFKIWFHAKNRGHTAHADDLKRELPLEVFKKIVDTITDNLGIPSIDLMTNHAVPKGLDGIVDHFRLGRKWENDKIQSLLEYGFFIQDPIVIELALKQGAELLKSEGYLVEYAFERNDSRLLALLVKYTSKPNELLLHILISQMQKGEQMRDFCSLAIKALIDKGGDHQLAKNISLFHMITEKNTAMAIKMLDEGADPNFGIPPIVERTAFYYALEKDLPQVAELMLNRASVETLGNAMPFLLSRDKDTFLPLITRILQEHRGLNLNGSVVVDRTVQALHIAINSGHSKETITLLCQNGANPCLRDNYNHSAWDVAINSNRTDLLSTLLPYYVKNAGLLNIEKEIEKTFTLLIRAQRWQEVEESLPIYLSRLPLKTQQDLMKLMIREQRWNFVEHFLPDYLSNTPLETQKDLIAATKQCLPTTENRTAIMFLTKDMNEILDLLETAKDSIVGLPATAKRAKDILGFTTTIKDVKDLMMRSLLSNNATLASVAAELNIIQIKHCMRHPDSRIENDFSHKIAFAEKHSHNVTDYIRVAELRVLNKVSIRTTCEELKVLKSNLMDRKKLHDNLRAIGMNESEYLKAVNTTLLHMEHTIALLENRSPPASPLPNEIEMRVAQSELNHPVGSSSLFKPGSKSQIIYKDYEALLSRKLVRDLCRGRDLEGELDVKLHFDGVSLDCTNG